MKNNLYLLLGLLIISMSSCDKTDSYNPELCAHAVVDKIESAVLSGIYDERIPSETIHNTSFFDLLSKFSSSSIRSEKEAIMYEFSKLGTKNSTEQPTLLESILYNSYFDIAQNRCLSERLKICDLYLESINAAEISGEIKERLIEAILFHRDLTLYLRIGLIEDSMPNKEIESKRNWPDCPYRDCLDCCMYWKAYAVEQSNWIDKARFLYRAAPTVAWWIVSCGWDCIFDNPS